MRTPEIGEMVRYHPRPENIRAGQRELAAMVTRVNPDNSLELTVYPWMSESFFQGRVHARSENLAGHCWSYADSHVARLIERVEELESMLDGLTAPKKPAKRDAA